MTSPLDAARRIKDVLSRTPADVLETQLVRDTAAVAQALLAGEAEARDTARDIMTKHQPRFGGTVAEGFEMRSVMTGDIAAAITAARAAEREARAKAAHDFIITYGGGDELADGVAAAIR